MRITVPMMVGAYSYLRTTQPFYKWSLPDVGDIQFGVCNSRKFYGFYRYWHKGRMLQHEIQVSGVKVRSPVNLLMTMAHEMTHVYQRTAARRDGKRRAVSHNDDFWRLASEICAVHGWPVNDF